jgi:GntR family transcriptional regulator/MocR family aminotransferase
MWSRFFQLAARAESGLQGQIRRMLVTAILDRRLPLDRPLPSSRELAQQLGVARNTVVLAYHQLVDEGFLVARARSGHFVNPQVLGGQIVDGHAHERGQKGRVPDWTQRFRFLPSQQRNIVKPADWQTYPFPFIYGQFDPAMFPTADWRECCMQQLASKAIKDWAPDLMAQDDASLIEQIRSRVLPRRGVRALEEEIVVTAGAQHALYLLADLLFTAGTTVGVEDPGYPDARNIFASRTARQVTLPVGPEGLPLDARLSQCDYVFVTPSHQCPTTVTLPLERREVLLRRAEQDDFVVIEDDYESENSFSRSPIPALKSLDRSERVIYVGSLSKAFAPGLRLGYIVGPPDLIREARALRRLSLRHASGFIQRAYGMFLALGHHDALLRRLSLAFEERARVLTESIAAHLPETSQVAITGGASCWVTGPPWLDARVLAALAAKHGILLEPGDVFFAAEAPPLNHFRLGFSSIAADRIEPGIRRLGRLMRELGKRAGRYLKAS